MSAPLRVSPPIYDSTLKEMRMGSRRVIHQGGQYSGKTVNILAALATLCTEEVDGGITTITSMSLPHLKGGALRDFEIFVYPVFKSAIKSYHKSDRIFTFKSGSVIEFKSFDSEVKGRGNKRKRLFINEANTFDYMLFFQLDSRSEQTILDYNPSKRFWCHEELLIDPEVNKIFISDHRHNPFLSEEKHREIENICVFKRDENGKVIFKKDNNGNPVPEVEKGNYELWKVYSRGLTGNIMGVIFPNWEIVDDDIFDQLDGTWIYSIDFGYTIDPTAIIKLCKIGDKVYVKELAYETGLRPTEIGNILKSNGFRKEDILYCEHDPDMIRALRNSGIINAMPARKGQGSVKAGIELLNEYKVFYTNSSKNIHKERGLYVWETDKSTGKLTGEPIDRDNHTFDAIRYGFYTKYLKKTV